MDIPYQYQFICFISSMIRRSLINFGVFDAESTPLSATMYCCVLVKYLQRCFCVLMLQDKWKSYMHKKWWTWHQIFLQRRGDMDQSSQVYVDQFEKVVGVLCAKPRQNSAASSLSDKGATLCTQLFVKTPQSLAQPLSIIFCAVTTQPICQRKLFRRGRELIN